MEGPAAEPHAKRRRIWFVGGVVVFLVLLLVTWGARAWRLAQMRATAPRQQQETVAEALTYAEQDFAAMQRALGERAQELARAPEVVQGLRRVTQPPRREGAGALVDYVAALDVPARWSIEVYDPTPRLIAWQGSGMPLGEAPEALGFLQGPQTAVVTGEEGQRQALAVWWPVRDEAQVVGAVRVMHMLRYQAPVENQYLPSYSLEEKWQHATKLPSGQVHVQFGKMPEETGAQHERLLRSVEGTVLGRVMMEPPSAERLVQAARGRFNDVLAFWAALLLAWLFIGLWSWYQAFRAPPAWSVHRRLMRATGRFALVAAAWWGVRYVLLALNVPARWLAGEAPLAPLFDPSHLALTVGGGLMRSTGDTLLTAFFGLLFGLAFLELAQRFCAKGRTLYRLRERSGKQAAERASSVRFLITAGGLGGGALALVQGLAMLTRRALLDSTLNYFAWEGLLPEPLVLVVFCALLLFTATVVMLLVGGSWIAGWLLIRYRPADWSQHRSIAAALGAMFVPAGGVYVALQLGEVGGGLMVAAFLIIGVALALARFVQRNSDLQVLTLRNSLLAIFLLTVLLYPLLYKARGVQQRTRMRYALASFEDEERPRVTFALEQVLRETNERVQQRLAATGDSTIQSVQSDSLATELIRGSLLSSLSLYDVSLTFFDTTGAALARSYRPEPGIGRRRLNQVDSLNFSILRQMHAEGDATGPLVEQITGRRERDRFQYIGVMPIAPEGRGRPIEWVMARAEPQTLVRGGGMPFPRVLLPAGLYGGSYTDLSLAEFRGRVLARSFGRDFGRYRLSSAVQRDLLTQPTLWRTERVRERRFLTYYQRQSAGGADIPPILSVGGSPVLAARVPATTTFDHLYYLLRLTVAGLLVGVPLYLLGLYLRYRAGRLPASRVRFRDRILNAFLGVGIVTAALVGFVGLRVVTGQNERAVQSWLRQYLDQAEETLVLESAGNEMPYHALSRLRIDSLASRVGTDLNLYTADRLVATSRPQLIREHLIDERLPIEVVQALYYEGYRFAYAEQQVGSYTYTTGFRALVNEQGQPRYVLAVPTLPEQERIEEEQAHTIAYLFGALLLLVLVVMLTASLIVRALTRPLAQLRQGLEAVARGRFERSLPVNTRDEIGELVETFNTTQEQLAESRRKLARQERQLAWREMARQVAHEIKNPLTPMKLSIQHLRRAYQRLKQPAHGEDGDEMQRFRELFERITSTLIEQIDTLARIANEFHTFARMPKRVPEPLDLNAVIQEAVTLMREEEGGVDIEENLHADPLVVEADHEELRRIYINLIKNAVQAIPDDRPGRIGVTTRQGHENGTVWAYSAVSDNGAGVPEELREKIFQPNFSTKTSGTGLGLAIAQKGISDLGGTINFETEEGTGTTFHLRLPLLDEA